MRRSNKHFALWAPALVAAILTSACAHSRKIALESNSHVQPRQSAHVRRCDMFDDMSAQAPTEPWLRSVVAHATDVELKVPRVKPLE
jgi:hypothetical protein